MLTTAVPQQRNYAQPGLLSLGRIDGVTISSRALHPVVKIGVGETCIGACTPCTSLSFIRMKWTSALASTFQFYASKFFQNSGRIYALLFFSLLLYGRKIKVDLGVSVGLVTEKTHHELVSVDWKQSCAKEGVVVGWVISRIGCDEQVWFWIPLAVPYFPISWQGWDRFRTQINRLSFRLLNLNHVPDYRE